jgi:hypothetical protein
MIKLYLWVNDEGSNGRVVVEVAAAVVVVVVSIIIIINPYLLMC